MDLSNNELNVKTTCLGDYLDGFRGFSAETSRKFCSIDHMYVSLVYFCRESNEKSSFIEAFIHHNLMCGYTVAIVQ
jgi:hypothetical protein